ncbi:hypothetical protein BVX95_00075 [archaeon D22]|nr:hypothetical protein BVX95_00075 [archaeon D22]
MSREYETKILDVDVELVEKRLLELGARFEGELFFRRYVFDIEKNEEWVRLRTDGKRTTITYKKRENTSIGGTIEHEIVVDDFEKSYEILSRLDFKNVYYQENKRRVFVLDGIEFSFDFWPKIPALLEVEGKNKEDVEKGLQLIGFEGKDIGDVSFVKVYERYGIKLNDEISLKFEE